jgi:hypothetical protein
MRIGVDAACGGGVYLSSKRSAVTRAVHVHMRELSQQE